jgi:peptidoglycan/LPS O-acetylase OafA/YrhL
VLFGAEHRRFVYRSVAAGDLSKKSLQAPTISKPIRCAMRSFRHDRVGQPAMTRLAENQSLTAIRGIAALAVVGMHLNAWVFPTDPLLPVALFDHGHAAVDLFFILSGFILAAVYRDIGGDGLVPFALHRLFRVFPLHLCVMLALGGLLLLAPLLGVALHDDAHHAWADFLPSLLLLQPYIGALDVWNTPSWSVGVELGCYLFFPIVMARARRWPAGWLPFAVLAAAGLEWLVLRQFGTLRTGLPALLRGFAGFNLGLLIQLAVTAWRPPARGWIVGGELAGLAVMALGVGLDHGAIIPLGGALLIAALWFRGGPVARALGRAPLVWLGEVSFAVYMIHDPVLKLVGHAVPRTRVPLAGTAGDALYATLLLLLILAVASQAHRWIEQPGRALGRRLAPRRASPTGAGLTTA